MINRSKQTAREMLEQQLRVHPPMQTAPSQLRSRVMAVIAEEQPAISSRSNTAYPLLVARSAPLVLRLGTLAAGLALVLGTLMLLQQWPRTTPAGSPIQLQQPLVSSRGLVDPAPLVIPAAQFFADSMDDPLSREAKSVMEDTRRAADFVVSCLPFTRGG